MLRLVQVLLFVAFSFFANTQDNASISFTIKNLGVNVDGHFNTFSINATFNSESDLISVFGKIDVASIETGIDSRDAHLLKEDYFHQEKFKYITLKSTFIKKKDYKNYHIIANLTIKGKTKEIKLPITVDVKNNKAKVFASFEINRRDFNVGGGSFVMSKKVKIQVTHYQKIL